MKSIAFVIPWGGVFQRIFSYGSNLVGGIQV